jgi:hypothetical protein
MSKGIGICDAGSHLVGLESPTYSNGSFRRVAQIPIQAKQNCPEGGFIKSNYNKTFQ